LYFCVNCFVNYINEIMIKRITHLLAFILSTSFFAGCLQVGTTLKVEKDGSGTINEKVLFSKTFVKMIKEFTEAFQDSGSTEEFTLFETDDIKADAKNYGENVKYVSHELVSNDNWEGYQAIYSFNDITKVQISPDPDSKVALDDQSTDTEEEEYYFFKFVKGDTPQLIIDRPDIELSAETDEYDDTEETEQNNEQEDEEFLKMMEGMKVDISVEVDGEIVNTNATYVQGSKITLFEMNLTEMMKNKEVFKEFKKNEPNNIEEMKQYLEKLPGLKIEVEKPITITFK
jgi:hypothetical protein